MAERTGSTDGTDTPEASGTAAGTGTAAAPDRASERRTARLAKHLRAFADAHGGSAEGQISYLGARGHRLVLVGADGEWGDQVAPGRELLAAAAERAGVTLRDAFDGEMAARVRTGRYEWTRMAGSQLGGPANG
jgi:hypothetical protein